MAEEGSPKTQVEEEGFFSSAKDEEQAFGKRQLGRRIAIMTLMLGLMLGGGIAVAWAIIAASK
jgi:hypothetical protein